MRTAILLIFLTFTTYGFSQTNQKYEYITLIQGANRIEVSNSSGSYETFNAKQEGAKDLSDFSPILKRITKLEEEGWELFSNNVYTHGEGINPYNYVLMRRKK
jgi:hypothetical protein